MFLKASGLNGVDALAIVLVNREDGLGDGEVVVESRCLLSNWTCYKSVGLPNPSQ